MEAEVVNPEPVTEPIPAAKPPLSGKKWFYTGGVLLSLIVLGGGIWIIRWQQRRKTPVMEIQNPPTGPTTAPTDGDRILAGFNPGKATWYPVPKIITGVVIFRPEEDDSQEFSPLVTQEAVFSEVAGFAAGERLIDVSIPVQAPGMSGMVVRILKSADGKYYYVRQAGDEWWESLDAKLLPEVGVTEQKIEGVLSPEEMMVAGMTFRIGYMSYDKFSELKNPIKIVETDYGMLYQTRTKILTDSDVFGRKIYLRLKDNYVVPYSLKTSLFDDDNIPQINWNNNAEEDKGFINGMFSSCGSSALMGSVPVVQDSSGLLTGKIQTGKAKTGEPVYQIKDPGNELVKSIYEQVYQVGRDQMITLTEFAGQENHFLWQDPLGDWQIWVNQEFGPNAECAKPVIYLYPTEDTVVNVRVEANISDSKPVYKTDGWTVTAGQSGKLKADGIVYDYLFWDGQGHGEYPDLRDRGVAVKQANIETTLMKNLMALGLNDRETADFLEFWLPKMPVTPYVRLTWLGTAEMDRLAPLIVSPVPDTKIRIFLEFEGLARPKYLKPQKLTAVKRVGFTLVEWGGLLISVR